MISREVERFADAISKPIGLADLQLDVSATFGVATLDDLSAEVVLQHANIAMYAAKANKSNVEYFRPDLDHLTSESLELVPQVREGIEKEHFEVYYQPKYDLASGRIIGCEGLVRWQHPHRGLVPPVAFIPMVEQLPICRELTHYVLERSIRDLARWQSEWPNIGLSVNLSARDANDPNLPLEIEALLRRYRVQPHLLTVELTEGTVLENQERTAAILSRIRHLGCGLAIDDFGTGYASISYLVKLPVTELKIDSSFVRDMDTNPQSNQIVKHCIDVGHALGLETTAEGIETDEIEAELRRMNCDVGQGYFVSRPVPLDDFIVFLRQNSHRTGRPLPARTQRGETETVATGVHR